MFLGKTTEERVFLVWISTWYFFPASSTTLNIYLTDVILHISTFPDLPVPEDKKDLLVQSETFRLFWMSPSAVILITNLCVVGLIFFIPLKQPD